MTLHRQLIAKTEHYKNKNNGEEKGACLPENITPGNHHVFAMDNLDCMNNTLSRGSFNAPSAIIIETRYG